MTKFYSPSPPHIVHSIHRNIHKHTQEIIYNLFMYKPLQSSNSGFPFNNCWHERLSLTTPVPTSRTLTNTQLRLHMIYLNAYIQNEVKPKHVCLHTYCMHCRHTYTYTHMYTGQTFEQNFPFPWVRQCVQTFDCCYTSGNLKFSSLCGSRADLKLLWVLNDNWAWVTGSCAWMRVQLYDKSNLIGYVYDKGNWSLLGRKLGRGRWRD